MRGYFGIGVEGISKQMNVGNLFRSAHAFGASFVFTVSAAYRPAKGGKSDTSAMPEQVPYYGFPNADEMLLPADCRLVGVELLPDAIELPSFRHPHRAAYVLGPERGELSPKLLARCDHILKIPAKFCVNVGIAGAIVMYDRMLSMGRFAPRPVRSGGPTETLVKRHHGDPIFRAGGGRYRKKAPAAED